MPLAAAGVTSARSPFALLALRDFRVWWLGFVVAALATSAHAFGVGWLVIELARGRGAGAAALYLGLIGLARAVPTIALSAFGGVAGDRHDRRNILVAAQAAMGVTALAAGLLVVTHAMTIAVLLVLSALNAAAAAFYHPVRTIIQPRLVGDVNLMRAIGLNGSVLSVSALVGPLIGGALVVAIGVGALMLACGIALVAVAASLATLRAQPVDRPATDSILRSLAGGLGFARRTPAILWLLIVFAGITLLVRPMPFVLPALARDVLHAGPRQLSWLVSAAGAGAVLSSLVLMWLRQSARQPRIALFVAIAAGLSAAVLAVQHSLLLALPFVALTQFFVMLSSGLIGVMLQTTSPDGFRGRIMGIQNLLADGGTESGIFLIGTIGGALGITTALGATGGALALLYLGIAIAVPVFTRTRPVAALARRADAT